MEELLSLLDDLEEYSEFVCYNRLGKNKKELQKKLKKLKNKIRNEKYDEVFKEGEMEE